MRWNEMEFVYKMDCSCTTDEVLHYKKNINNSFFL